MVGDGRGTVGDGELDDAVGSVAISVTVGAVAAFGGGGGDFGFGLLVDEEADVVALVFLQELQGQPAEDVVHDGLGHRDVLVVREAGRLEAAVDELIHQRRKRDAVLEGQGDRGGEAVHQAGDGGTLFGHADEDLAGIAGVRVQAHRNVSLVAADRELVRYGRALVGQAAAHRVGLGLGRDGQR
ncbi:MAG: hypothetical protein JWQ02_1472 [Capsulimonas sp.]|nr:hypothetical protein [Capsulimonas sp.]